MITTTVGKTPNLYIILQVVGVKLIFTWGHISLVVAFKGPKVILGLYKCNTPELGSRSSVLPLGRNKVPGRIKHGGGPDSACGPCVCHLRVVKGVAKVFLEAPASQLPSAQNSQHAKAAHLKRPPLNSFSLTKLPRICVTFSFDPKTLLNKSPSLHSLEVDN